MQEYWGYHLILDCSMCNIERITNKEIIEFFVKTLVKSIDMVAHGEPQLELLLPGTDNEGYSLLQMITTSNITAHFVNKNGAAFIDVFSCKEFDAEVVKQTVQTFFEPVIIKETFLKRNAE